MPNKPLVECIDFTEEELMSMKRKEITAPLVEMQQRFCEEYIRCYSIKLAAIKAGYEPNSAHRAGYMLRKKPDIKNYICWLKLHAAKEVMIDAKDILEQYLKIGFADITDFVDIEHNQVRLKDGVKIDGQMVKSLSRTDSGVKIEMYNKLDALDKLARYFDYLPKDWNQTIQERKLAIMEEELLIKKAQAGLLEDDDTSSFMSALKDTTKSTWEDD